MALLSLGPRLRPSLLGSARWSLLGLFSLFAQKLDIFMLYVSVCPICGLALQSIYGGDTHFLYHTEGDRIKITSWKCQCNYFSVPFPAFQHATEWTCMGTTILRRLQFSLFVQDEVHTLSQLLVQLMNLWWNKKAICGSVLQPVFFFLLNIKCLQWFAAHMEHRYKTQRQSPSKQTTTPLAATP